MNQLQAAGSSQTATVTAFLAALSAVPPAIAAEVQPTYYAPLTYQVVLERHPSSGAVAFGSTLSSGETADDEVLCQIEGLFKTLIVSQSEIEDEFAEVIYKNRSDLYALF